MSNPRQLERRVEAIERQVTGHHRHGTIASRLARLEDTVSGDPMKQSSIAERLDEIEASYRGEPIPERIDEALGDAETGDSLDERIENIETRLADLETGIDDGRDPAELTDLLDRIEMRLLALERARDEE